MRVNANVILARCRTGQLYGVRVEERNHDWYRTWAFPIREDLAVQEGFDKVKIEGSFDALPDYPGCPYCGSKGFFVCGTCSANNCWDGEELTKCSWCGTTAKTITADVLDVSGGGY